jgi:hypothetical protein
MRALVAALVLISAAAPAAAEQPTRIELYTMGSGDDVFEAFGHSTLCVLSEQFPPGACYNYGTTDFTSPARLVWDVLRGRALFWVARAPLPIMLQAYIDDDRTIYRQQLELPAAAAEALAARLERDLLPEHRTYVYHHYRDNCATRLRDHLDVVTGGALSREADGPFPTSFRELTQGGFAASVLLLAGMEVLVGRRVDRQPTLWEAMFLPDVLRAQVERRLGVAPEVVFMRRGPVPELPLLAGRHAVLALAVGLTLVVVLGALWRPAWRLALVVMALILGLVGLLAAATAGVALLPELRQNEILLVLLPTDLAIALLRGRLLLAYLAARLVLAAIVALALLAGVLVQPMWAAWALAAGPLAVATLRAAAGTRAALDRNP